MEEILLDEFNNRIEHDLFESTNAPWNDLHLNEPWSVGYVADLVQTSPFQNKEEWECFYYSSGEKREVLIAANFSYQTSLLENYLLPKSDVYRISPEIAQMNFEYGRTISQLAARGKALYSECQKRGIRIDEEVCIEAVRFRVICQTWNGVIIAERSCIRELSSRFPSATFKKMPGSFDYKYAVDFEIESNYRIICGIQIKPKAYTYSKPHINKDRYANQAKNALYMQEFHRPVFNIIYYKGKITSTEAFSDISQLLGE